MKVGVLGATGYGGIELCRILSAHDKVDLCYIASESNKGNKLSDVMPHFNEPEKDLILKGVHPEKEDTKELDLVFAALPHKVSMDVVPKWLKEGVKVIDLSGDYRLKDTQVYQKWYGITHKYEEVLKDAVYGLCEINKESIKKASLVANPGCFPTGVILPLYPMLEKRIIDKENIIADCKTGVSGGGKEPKQIFHYPERNNNFQAYNVASHRHGPEMEQALSKAAGENLSLLFSPHLVPMDRGIFSTIYVSLKDKLSKEDVSKCLEEFYKDSPFAMLLEGYPQVKWVYGTNSFAVSFIIDENTNTLILMSVIDNLIKGASGQAVQNMNIMCGFEEDEGLLKTALWP